MADFIHRQHALDVLSEVAIDNFSLSDSFQVYLKALNDASERIEKIPSAYIKEVRRGKWLFCASTEDLMCSNCLHYWIPNGDQYDYHYCPNCGAIMNMKGE